MKQNFLFLRLGYSDGDWKLLDKSTRISYFRIIQQYFTSYFSKSNGLVHCYDAARLLEELSFSEHSNE